MSDPRELASQLRAADGSMTEGPWVADANIYGPGTRVCCRTGALPKGDKIADVCQSTCGLSRDQSMGNSVGIALLRNLAPSVADALESQAAEIERLRGELLDAYTSLRALSSAGGRDMPALQDLIDVRGYANSRANAAQQALGERRKGEFYPCKPDIFAVTYTPPRCPCGDSITNGGECVNCVATRESEARGMRARIAELERERDDVTEKGIALALDRIKAMAERDAALQALDAERRAREEAEAQLEWERVRLAACGVAALANTDKAVQGRIGCDNPYWSASYGNVCDAVDREMALRAEVETLTKAREEAETRLAEHSPDCAMLDRNPDGIKKPCDCNSDESRGKTRGND